MSRNSLPVLAARSILALTAALAVAPSTAALACSSQINQGGPRIDCNSGTTKPSAKIESESCWRPGMSRNIGIAERACDPFTSKPESMRSLSRKRH